jgi:hypothetical protein
MSGTGFRQRILLCVDLLFSRDVTWLATNSHLITKSKAKGGVSDKLLLVFASTIIPGFSLLELHDQDFYPLLEMYVFRNTTSSSTRKISVTTAEYQYIIK